MTRPRVPSLVTSLLALAPVVAVAQRAEPPGLPIPYPPRETYRHPHRVTTMYDEARDRTVLQLDPVRLDATHELSAVVALEGARVRTDARAVIVTIWRRTLGDTARTVTVARHDWVPAAGAARPRVLASVTPWRLPGTPAGYAEVLLVAIPTDAFVQLALLETVTLAVGSTVVPLPPTVRTALRDFASRMAPGTPVMPAH